LIFIGVIVVIVILRKKPVSKAALALNSEQQAKLKQLLADNADESSHPASPSVAPLTSASKEKE